MTATPSQAVLMAEWKHDTEGPRMKRTKLCIKAHRLVLPRGSREDLRRRGALLHIPS